MNERQNPLQDPFDETDAMTSVRKDSGEAHLADHDAMTSVRKDSGEAHLADTDVTKLEPIVESLDKASPKMESGIVTDQPVTDAVAPAEVSQPTESAESVWQFPNGWPVTGDQEADGVIYHNENDTDAVQDTLVTTDGMTRQPDGDGYLTITMENNLTAEPEADDFHKLDLANEDGLFDG